MAADRPSPGLVTRLEIAAVLRKPALLAGIPNERSLNFRMKKQSIMVVEDERIIARDIQATLQRAGYHVPSLAASGEEAVAIASRVKPDLVLMDIVLQGQMDGIMAAGRIRQDFGIPVIYLSSYGDPPILERAKATEPIGYILKPYEEKDLLTTIEMVLHQYQASQERAESALLASEARFRAIFDTCALGIALVNREGRFLETNGALREILGCESAEMVRKTITDFAHPGDQEEESSLFKELMDGKRDQYRLQKREFSKAGKVIWVQLTASVFPGSGSSESRRFAVRMTEDITEQKHLEEQFLRAQRMECIGMLASGLAHNLGNVLVPVTAGVGLLQPLLTEPSGSQTLAVMDGSLRRAVGIVRQLLTLGRGEDGQMVPMLPRDLLEEIGRFVRELFPKSIQTRIRVPAEPQAIMGDANALHQALLNLCANARDAMPQQGSLVMSIENTAVDAAKARLHPGIKAGPFVVFSVKDTGSGMSEDVIERIFDPFFTTKPTGQGTGLGLSTTLGIIKRHKGFIEVESQPGKGTEFRLYIPALETVVPSAAG